MPIFSSESKLLSSSELSKSITSRFFFVSGGLLSGDLSVLFPSRLRRSLYDIICDSYTDNHFVREIAISADALSAP